MYAVCPLRNAAPGYASVHKPFPSGSLHTQELHHTAHFLQQLDLLNVHLETRFEHVWTWAATSITSYGGTPICIQLAFVLEGSL
jgi:hypothetical protein